MMVEDRTERVLGAYLVGPHDDEVINLFALAIRHDLTAPVLKQTMFAYPPEHLTWATCFRLAVPDPRELGEAKEPHPPLATTAPFDRAAQRGLPVTRLVSRHSSWCRARLPFWQRVRPGPQCASAPSESRG